MVRLLSILIALPMLMPQGTCLRKFDCMGWLSQTSFPVPSQTPGHVRMERTKDPHPAGCRCGCQKPSVETGDNVANDCESAGNPRVKNGLPPEPHQPCCPAVCKSKFDRIGETGNPAEVADDFVAGFVSATPMFHFRPAKHRLGFTFHSPPLYISFRAFRI